MIYTSIFGTLDPPRTDIQCFGGDNRWNAKVFKILSHLWCDEPCLWVDGNIFPLSPEAEILDSMLQDADIGVFKHPYRNTPTEELKVLVAGDILPQAQADNMMNEYGSALDTLPLYEAGIIARRPTDAVKRMNETWWKLVRRWSIRDQITFPIAVAESGIKLHVVEANLREHPMFKYVPHHV